MRGSRSARSPEPQTPGSNPGAPIDLLLDAESRRGPPEGPYLASVIGILAFDAGAAVSLQCPGERSTAHGPHTRMPRLRFRFRGALIPGRGRASTCASKAGAISCPLVAART